MSDTEADLESFGGAAEKPRKERSPSYPFISLRKAIERAKTFESNHKRLPTRVAAAAHTWGYGAKSSGALQTAAALKAFGLLEEIATPGERKLQITDIAYRILHDSRPGAKENAVSEAALKPKLFAECSERWGADYPSDDHRISELRFERGFTDDAARNFIKVFDDTMSMLTRDRPANLAHAHSDVADFADAGPGQQNQAPSSAQEVSTPVGEPSTRPTATERAVFPLPEGLVVLEVPAALSKDSYEDLSAWIEVMLRRIKRSIRD